MPWGGPPSADLLQNIVSSVIRQGLVPGVEGVTVHIPSAHGSVVQQVSMPMPTLATQGPTAATQGAQNTQEQTNAAPQRKLI